MKIAYTKETLAVLESLQIQAENKNSPFMPKAKFDAKHMAEQLNKDCSPVTNDVARIKSTVNFFKSYKYKLPTKYEDPIDYPRLVIAFEKAVEVASELGYELPETISIGTVCSGELNAHIIPVGEKKDQYLLVFNRQVFLFSQLFARYIAWLISKELKTYTGNQTLTPRKPTESETKKLDEIVYYLINKIEFHRDNNGEIGLIAVVDKTEQEPPFIQTDEVGNTFKEMMIAPMIAFVIGHELAHIHLMHKKALGEHLELNTAFMEELFCDQTGLHIADRTANLLYKKHYPKGWQKFASVSPIFFLSCLDITQKAAYTLNNGKTPPRVMEVLDTDVLENNVFNSYPTTLFRLAMIQNILSHEAQRECAPNSVDWMFENSNWIDSFLVECWKEIKGLYVNRGCERKKVFNHYQEHLKQHRQ